MTRINLYFNIINFGSVNTVKNKIIVLNEINIIHIKIFIIGTYYCNFLNIMSIHSLQTRRYVYTFLNYLTLLNWNYTELIE